MTRQLDSDSVGTDPVTAEPPPDGRYAASTAAFERANQSLAGGVSSNFRAGGDPVPLFFDHAAGAHLVDVDGNDYVDYVLGMGPGILGHAPGAGRPRRPGPGRSRASCSPGRPIAEIELAERFTRAVACAERVRFGSSGTEMVQAALRLARAATGREVIAKFEGHYHGWLDPVLASVQPPIEDAGPADAPTPHLPSRGQPASTVDQVVVLPWNDRDALQRVLGGPGRERIAALILEPILCNTGVIPPEPGFLEAVRSLTAANGTVLIFDEVITGFRVGYGGAQEVTGVTPDLAVFAKAMGSGFPIAALAGRRIADGAHVAGRAPRRDLQRERLERRRGQRDAGDPRRRRLRRLQADRADGRPADRGPPRARGAAGQRPAASRAGRRSFNTTFGSGPVRDYRDYAATDRARQRTVPAGAPGSRRAGDRARHVVPVGGARRRRHRGHAGRRRRRARRRRLTPPTRSARPVA